MIRDLLLWVGFLMSAVPAWAQTPSRPSDTTVHTVRFVAVAPDLKLEVLDYGGVGEPMVFLTALGPDAHEWDKFAPKFTNKYHVVAITRRGFGASDKPAVTDESYSSDQLGDDVLAVMEMLQLQHPVLVGWSVGGEELSSIGSRFPEKVKALIYLDAGYPYAFYPAGGEPLLDRAELRRLLSQAARENPLTAELEQKLLDSVSRVEQQLRADIANRAKTASAATSKVNDRSQPTMPPMPPEIIAIMTNGMKYTKVNVPTLAIYATPPDLGSNYADPTKRAAAEEGQAKFNDRSAAALQAAVPNARVVRIAHARHDVWVSNESEVIREMTGFLSNL